MLESDGSSEVVQAVIDHSRATFATKVEPEEPKEAKKPADKKTEQKLAKTKSKTKSKSKPQSKKQKSTKILGD